MATLVELKREVEDHIGHSIKMTFTGAAEAHLLAKELAEANIGVIVTPPRAFPYTWEERRMYEFSIYSLNVCLMYSDSTARMDRPSAPRVL